MGSRLVLRCLSSGIRDGTRTRNPFPARGGLAAAVVVPVISAAACKPIDIACHRKGRACPARPFVVSAVDKFIGSNRVASCIMMSL